MSSERLWHEAQRWLRTAQEDLRASEVLRDAGLFSHSCFLAQQSAEKAVKSIHLIQDRDPWGHGIQKLLADLPEPPPAMVPWQDYLDKAAALDRFYIPARYPNGLPDLTPGTTFTRRDADTALVQARTIVEAAENSLRPGQG
ncbi:MAG TPA: HEPN domain-containing protein [Kiritimatiellia bacterium]|jgi:HEPN domain-containing protein|nr:HEPN domain-containing protein [Kiritimatiellia bacterium]HPC20338.1 HEPN domain-containing protein [Kiritimatiellia bacterium]HQQ60571.1 HEPN domain-containing protein [Kiritimatiellia bacterium]